MDIGTKLFFIVQVDIVHLSFIHSKTHVPDTELGNRKTKLSESCSLFLWTISQRLQGGISNYCFRVVHKGLWEQRRDVQMKLGG